MEKNTHFYASPTLSIDQGWALVQLNASGFKTILQNFDRRSSDRTSIDQGDFGDLGCSRVFRPKNLWLISVGRPKAPNWHRIEKWAFWTFNRGRLGWSSVNWRPLLINPWWASVQPKDLGIKRKLFLDEPSEPKLVILGRPEFHGASLMIMEVSHYVILGWKPT